MKTYKSTPIRLPADCSTEILQARREWHDIFKMIKGKNLQTRIFYPARLPFRSDGEIRSFPGEQKLKEFSTTKPALQQMPEELLQAGNTTEGKDPQKINPNFLNCFIKKMVIGSYISMITLNINGLNAPAERHKLAEQVKTCMYAFPLSTSLCLTPQNVSNYFTLLD